MNAATMPARQLAMLLTQAAGGMAAESAAVTLIAEHGHFLHQPEFRHIIAAGSTAIAGGGEPVAVIRWNAALAALSHGRLPVTPAGRAVLQIAASIAEPSIAVRLGASLPDLDQRSLRLIHRAITTAACRPSPLEETTP